tara:strand:- start:1126 stop:1368 length:243 start_codon:yes stop_codon:yes gene_type:complete
MKYKVKLIKPKIDKRKKKEEKNKTKASFTIEADGFHICEITGDFVLFYNTAGAPVGAYRIESIEAIEAAPSSLPKLLKLT